MNDAALAASAEGADLLVLILPTRTWRRERGQVVLRRASAITGAVQVIDAGWTAR